jgi:hypothetical protein
VVNFTLRPLHLLGNKSGIHWVGPDLVWTVSEERKISCPSGIRENLN